MKAIYKMLKDCEIITWIIIISTIYSANAQNEGNIWYFGSAGLDFNSGSPVALTNSAMIGGEGNSTISDSSGNLLFYSNGMTVWNKNHQVMTNGTGLMAGYSSSQAALIVKKPCANNLYYVFTTPHQTQSADGLRYSIVDMDLQNGLGEVIQKNALVFQPVLEKITAIRHKNDIDIWILTHQWNSNNFLAYLLTANGLSSTPVISSVGAVHTGPPGSEENAMGVLKASLDGTMISIAIGGSGIYEVLKFDNTNGVVANPITISTYDRAYSTEFSPNGNFLYFNGFHQNISHFLLYQADLSGPWNNTFINNSITIIDTIPIHQSGSGGGTAGAFQFAPDGKIYVGVYGGTYLSAITDPDQPGLLCNFTDTAVSLNGKICSVGFPNFINDQFLKHEIIYSKKCAGDSTVFSLSNNSFSSVTWNFGDPASLNNTSNQTQPLHVFSTQGIFTVSAIVDINGVIDTLTRDFNIYPSVNIANVLGPDTVLCPGDTLEWELNIPCADYLWSNGSVANSMSVSDSGLYWVEVNSSCGVVRDSVYVIKEVPPIPLISPQGSIFQCDGDSILLTGSGSSHYLWNTGDTTNSIYVSSPGTYYFNSNNKCGSVVSDSVIIISDSLPLAIITGPTDICPGGNPVNLIASGGDAFVWSTGDSTATISVSTAGNYFVITSNNCGTDSAFINITQIAAPVVTILGSTTFCDGDSVQLNAQANNVLWSTGDTTSSIFVSETGVYFYTTNSSCGILVSDSIFVEVNQAPVVSVEGPTVICSGNNAIVNASGGEFYNWSTGETTPSINITQAGNYYVLGSNICGSDTAFFNLSVLEVNAYFTTDIASGEVPLTVNFQNLSNGATDYHWSFGDGNTSSDSSIVYTFLIPGVYNVILTASNGDCIDKFQMTIIVEPGETNLFYPSALTPNSDGNNDNFMVYGTGIKTFRAKIFNRWGELIYQWNDIRLGWNGLGYNGNMQPDGVYIIDLEAKGFDGVTIRKTSAVTLIR